MSIFDSGSKEAKNVNLQGAAYWLGRNNQLLVTTKSAYKYDQPGNPPVVTPGKVNLVDAASASVTKLLEGPNIREALPSPDGNYFALRQSQNGVDPTAISSLINSFVTFRSIKDANTDLTPAFEQGTAGRSSSEPHLVSWNADGTFVQLQSFASLTAGATVTDNSYLSLLNGKDLKKMPVMGSYMNLVRHQLAVPFYTFTATHTYKGPEAPTEQLIKVQNFDGSEQTVIYSATVAPNEPGNETPIRLVQVVQVP